MKKALRVLKIALFNLLLLFVLMEVTALAGYLYRTGNIYYLDPPSGRSVGEDLASSVVSYRLHPYLGFIIRPSATVREEAAGGRWSKEEIYNNYGFIAADDYPYPRRGPEEVLVGIFGGSAAAHLATFEAREGILARSVAPVLGRRPEEVTVLNFAQGGYKQPQQLLIYDYFRALGQELDLVINFDGFNEIVLTRLNARQGVAVDMPSIEHVGALRQVTGRGSNAEEIERLLRVRADWGRYAEVYNRAWSREGWELTFASGFLVDFLIYRHYLGRYQRGVLALGERERSESLSWLYLNRPADPAAAGDAAADPDAAALERAVALWRRASGMMQRRARSSGALYLHFVQPNQYYPTARTFSAEERRVAINDFSPYAGLVPEGYSRLERQIVEARSEGLAVEGLFRLLDETAEPVYVDDCCHFTDLGQRLLLEHIGAVAAAELAGAPPAAARPAHSM
jgi:hypothetical protein